ncbi:MAG: hypothetical protein J1F35_05940 [Erysipelotrichales bacterium]|nr:hypothetical protein [Erysipelotrichales bacterium]
MEISISKLTKTFPGYIWWENGAELCGINFDTKQQITIEDGMCISEDGTWVVFGYNLKEIPEYWRKLKYESSDDKFMEDRIKLVW